jgi:hypothetical protein
MNHIASQRTSATIMLVLGLVGVFCIVLLPQGVLAQCSTDITKNYTACIDHFYSQNPTNTTWVLEQCSCCVVSSSESLDQCPPLASCNKPIGVAILPIKNIALTGGSNYLIKSAFTDTDGPCADCCNVGILVNNQMEAKLEGSYISIDGVTVKNWANGIMLWKISQATIIRTLAIQNGIGVYVFNSKTNYIITTQISNNKNSGIYLESTNPPQGPPMSFNNYIYNNYFDNPVDVSLNEIHLNYWNTSGSGTNIIGGSSLGGNYWVGYSDTCDCSGEGFCLNPFTVATTNVDYLPLCTPPYIDINVEGVAQNWMLRGGENYNEALSIEVSTNAHTWSVSAIDNEENKRWSGHLEKYNISGGSYDDRTYLHELLEVNASSSAYFTLAPPGSILITQATPKENDHYPIGMRQKVVTQDVALPEGYTYRMRITFTATIQDI